MPLAGGLIVPAHDEPQHQRDREQRQRVDLLVHHRLVPHGERRGCDERPRHRGEAARQPRGNPRAHPALAHQEPAPGRDRARDGRQQIDPHRVSRRERQQTPDVGDQYEQWVAGRMRDAEYVGGGDVFRGVPELRGRRQRQHVQDEGAQGHEACQPIGRPLRFDVRRLLVGHARSIGDQLSMARPPAGAYVVLARIAAPGRSRAALRRSYRTRRRIPTGRFATARPPSRAVAVGRPSHRPDTPRTGARPIVARSRNRALPRAAPRRSPRRAGARAGAPNLRRSDRERDRAGPRNCPWRWRSRWGVCPAHP